MEKSNGLPEEDKLVNQRIEKVKKFFSKKAFFLLLLILLFALGIRIYYLFIVENQPIWWDEGEYLSTAKHWAFNVPYQLSPQRPPLFQALITLTFLAGLNETLIKFLLVVIPSVFLVYLVYLLGKEMFNEKIGLIVSFLTAIHWSLLFWTTRFQPDIFTMCFQVLAIFFMWKYWKSESKNKQKLIILAGFFSALAFYFKVSALLVPLSFAVFILIKDRISAFKNKDYYIFSISFLITLLPYFIWAYLTFEDPFAFRQGYSDAALSNSIPFGWYTLNFFYYFTQTVFFVLFIIGLILSLEFFLYLDLLVKNKKKCFSPEIFGIVVLLVVTSFYIFYIRGAEDRWLFLWLPFIFIFTAKALIFIYDVIKKQNEYFSLIALFIMLGFITFSQLSIANELIILKKESYSHVKLAGEWLKSYANKHDKVLTSAYPQIVYYSELNITHLTSKYKNPDLFKELIETTKPRFLVFLIGEFLPEEAINSWLQQNQNKTKAVQVYYSDPEKEKVIGVILEINWN